MYALVCLGAFAVASPLGGNLSRMPLLLAGPLVLLADPIRAWRVLLVVPVVVGWQAIEIAEVANATIVDASTTRDYYDGVLRFFDGVPGPVRVEIPATSQHWEAAYVGASVALAAGWERQLDRRLNPEFYDREHPLDASRYEAWLSQNGVSYVALPDTAFDPSSKAEARLVRSGLDYLTPVYRDAHWTVYRMDGAQDLLDGPGRLIAVDGRRIVFDARHTGPFVVRVRSSAAWQVATGNACTGAGRDDWLTVDVVTPGRIVLTQRVDWLTLLEDDADRSCHEDRQVAIPTSGHFLRARQPGDRLAAVVDTGPLLRIDGLTKRYPGTTALDDLTLEVPRGRIGLVGANGAGKTTTFRLLLGLAHPTEGHIEVCGLDVARDPIGVRARLGYMPEHDCLPLDQTAADVVSTFGELSGLPARAARQRASDILDLVGLDEARFRPIGEFSTGMRQRAKLAQAIVGDPELVLLDEPTAGLDPVGRDDMLALVARLGSFGISVLMATHLLDDVQKVCDHVVMIDAGRLVVAGATDSLLERTGTVTVDVGPRRAELVAALGRVNLPAVAADGIVEVEIAGDEDLDTLRDVIAELELPLYRLSTRLTSLDEVFLRRAEDVS